jgi:hypothetical protein
MDVCYEVKFGGWGKLRFKGLFYLQRVGFLFSSLFGFQYTIHKPLLTGFTPLNEANLVLY